MVDMGHRQRVLAALNHEEPDRVPMDLGGAMAAGMNVKSYARLLDYLGIEERGRLTQTPGARFQLASYPEALLERFDVDLRPLYPAMAEKTPELYLDKCTLRDQWGVVWSCSEDGGHFFLAPTPFQGKEPTVEDIDRHAWPDPRDPGRLKGLKEEARRLHEETDYAVVLNLPYGVVRYSQMVRGFTEFLEDLMLNPPVAEALMEHSLAFLGGLAQFLLKEIGDYVDVVQFPDDLGFQDQPYVSPSLYRKRVKDYHRRMVEMVKAHTKAKFLLHSDGAVYPLISDFVDAGVDAINPVQVSCKGMDDTRRLKEQFGARLSFWGSIDTHHVMPRGTTADVRDEVRRRIGELAPGGGFVLASVQSLQAEVPPENVVAMFDAALEYGRYQ